MTALGFIETKGLLAAIEGADAMLKAADVRLVEKNFVGGGLVSVTIAGEVASVRAAVDAAIAAIANIGGATLVSEHVIARPDEGVARIIATQPVQDEVEQAPIEQEQPSEAKTTSAPVQPEAPKPAPAERKVEAAPKAKPARHDISQLKKMKVPRLRQVARSLGNLSMARDEIKSAKKKDLIEAIMNAYRKREE